MNIYTDFERKGKVEEKKSLNLGVGLMTQEGTKGRS